MPKVDGTRKQRAVKLLERLQRGPSMFFLERDYKDLGPRELQDSVTARYRAWAESWILEDVQALIPELRKGKN
jgi:hypothetical protein